MADSRDYGRQREDAEKASFDLGARTVLLEISPKLSTIGYELSKLNARIEGESEAS